MKASEFQTIAALARLFDGKPSRRVAAVGIGDDAAVLRGTHRGLVWTVDASVEGVHFDRRWLSFESIGARSFHAAVSDLAAMGARPVAALSALVLPRSMRDADVSALARGQAVAAKALGAPILGGNISRGRELSITTTVLGSAKRPLRRDGARPGDELWLLGDVGLAGAGLLALSKPSRGRRVSSNERQAIRACEEAWRSPCARIRDGLALVGRAHAAIDVSDGLAGDARHVAEASRVRVVIEEEALRASLPPALVGAARALRADALELALSGGEDYALLATGPGKRRPRGARRVGRIETGRGVSIERGDGTLARTVPGFDHFK